MIPESGYPLTWPVGWARSRSRRRGSFGSAVGWSDGRYEGRRLTISQSTNRILDECHRFGATEVVISSNLKLRNDGLPHSAQRAVADPGVAVYFKRKGKPQCVPCDKYDDPAQNLAGVAAVMAAMRTLERHGSGILDRAFLGFEALPHLPARRPWYEVLEVDLDADHDTIRNCYMALRSKHHPDKGGSAAAFDEIVKAYEEWTEQLQNGVDEE
jgi:hypothetical protein